MKSKKLLLNNKHSATTNNAINFSPGPKIISEG